MKIKLIITLSLLWGLTATNVHGESFRYPTIPDSLKSADERADYLMMHYWDCFNFNDTLQLKDSDNVEQGFVNYIDMLGRLSEAIRNGKLHPHDNLLQESVAAFCSKAFATTPSKDKFQNLIGHYLDDPQSPMRNDRTYLLLLNAMKNSPYLEETEKERVAFKIKTKGKNLPGDIALNFTFTDKEGKQHQLRDYTDQKVILYFYDPDCENCHRISAWLDKQTIPQDYTFLNVHADDSISELYSLEPMPTIYLLDKGNKTILKDCPPEMLMEAVKAGL